MKKHRINFKSIKSKDIFKVILIIALFGIMTIINLNGENIFNPELTIPWLKDKFTRSKGNSSFPISVNGEKIKAQNFNLINGYITIVSDSSFTCFNKAGKLVANFPHSFSEPVLKIKEDKILIYDLNHKDLQIGFKSNILEKIKLKNNIVASDLSAGVVYGVVTKGENFSCNLEIRKLFSKEPIFEKKLTNEYVTDLAINEYGTIAVVFSSVFNNGELTSKVTVIDINKKKEKFVFWSNNNMLFFSSFITNSLVSANVLAIGDNSLILLNAIKGKEINYNFENKKLAAFDVNKSAGFVIALSDSESRSNSNILLFNKNGNFINEIKTSLKITALSYNYGVIAALSYGNIYFYKPNGKNIGTIPCSKDVKNIKLISNKKVLIISSNKISVARL